MNDTPMHHAGPHSDAHGGVRVRAEYSDGAGTLTFEAWGRCTLAAAAGVLAVEADDEQDARRIQGIVAADLERFGHRKGLNVVWRPSS